MSEIILGGRYLIENEIGAGGMAIVYKAHDNMLNRSVAVKVLRPEFKEDDEFIKRFDIEAKASAGLNHPNIVSVYDVGIHEGLHYIVMEYVEGITLKELIARDKKLSWNEALRISRQICSALSHAHARKVIHRDIKPHNIMVKHDGSVKVMDFGIARAASAATMTIGSKVLGSAHYLSPEQARGGFTDERSDIYSLGVCMYEMVVGKVPFDADTTVAVAMQHLQKEPVAPSELTEGLPYAVEHIILKAMRKEQSQRYLSAAAMESDISRVIHNPSVVLSDEDSDAAYYSTKQTEEDDKAKILGGTKKKSGMTGVFVALACVVVAIVAFFATRAFLGGKTDLKVPNIKGLTIEQAYERLSEIDEEINIIVRREEYGDFEDKDKIVEQEPEEGMKLPGTKEIEVVICLGEESFELDNYVGLDAEKAKEKAEKAGLIVTIEDETNDDLNEQYKEGVVTNQSVEPGSTMQYEDEITLYRSKGEENLLPKVPYVIGKNADEAKAELIKEGFRNVDVMTKESDITKGLVISQSVQDGTRTEYDTQITLTVSSGMPADEGTALIFTLPSGSGSVNVKVIKKENGESVYVKQHNAGETVKIDVKVTGQVTYEIYLDDVFWEEKSVNG